MTRFVGALALAAVLFISGCSALRTEQRPSKPWIRPSAIAAEGVVTIKKTIPLSGRARIIAKSPDLFKIDVFGPFGQVMAMMAGNAETLSVFTGGETKQYGWNDRRLPYHFKSRDVVSFLLGLGNPGIKGPFKSSTRTDDYEVSTDEDGRVTEFVKIKNGIPVLTVSLSDYRAVSGASVPFDITIKDLRDTIRIRYSTVEVNPGLSRDAFDVPVSKGEKNKKGRRTKQPL